MIAGGLVLLTVTADRLFAHEVTRREWIGVALAAAGLAFLAATLEGAGDERPLRLRERPAGRVSSCVVLGAAVAVAALLAARGPRAGVMLGAVGGAALGRLGHLDQGAQRSSATPAPRRSWPARWPP